MCKIKTHKVYTLDELPDETFETEADAAAASILIMLGITPNLWDIVDENLRRNGAEIQQRLRILMEPRNVKT